MTCKDIISRAPTCKTLAILATKVPFAGHGSGWWYSSTTSSPAASLTALSNDNPLPETS